jgi:hypothetical protein
MNPNGEYRYYIEDDELKERPFDHEAYDIGQKAKERDRLIVTEIRKIYTIDEEFKILNLGIL